MDETLIIDNLAKPPTYYSRPNFRNYEFFECDWCGDVCQMPIEEYKTYAEDVILKSKYRCKGCAKKMGRGRPRKTENTTVNKQLTTTEQNAENHFTDVTKMVDHPPHYTAGGIECIDAIESAVDGLDPKEAVHVANIIKYVWRFKRKNGKQDLEKAQWYLKRLTDMQEG